MTENEFLFATVNSGFNLVSHQLFRGAIILLALITTACSGSENNTGEPDHIRILDEIPEHIRELENLTIFPGDSEPRYSIELIPEQAFGETGEPYLTTLYGAVEDDRGRVIIHNANTNHEHSIYVYNADGTYHTQIGGPGRGPGEFGFVISVQASAGKVFARDITNQRLNIYNTDDYSFVRSMMIEQLEIRNHEAVRGLQLGLILPRNDGNYQVSFSQRVSDTYWQKVIYLLMDSEGNTLDFEPVEFQSSPRAQGEMGGLMPTPFMGTTITYTSDDGALYSAWNHDFLIRKHDANGDYQFAIYYPVTGSAFDLSYHTPTPFFDRDDVLRAIDKYDQKLPESNPIIDLLKVDDYNRIWAAVPMDPQRKVYEWWILGESGELLAKLQRPRNKTIFDIKNGYLYAKEIDEETDIEYVVKYRMEFREVR